MYDNQNMAAAGKAVLGGSIRDPLDSLTCGQNLERKIHEQKERLASLQTALDEMKASGLYNVKISTLRDTMSY